ncbi:MAG: hypothetical protein ACI9K5_003120, partial [Gammaproteobacteria bacterium]
AEGLGESPGQGPAFVLLAIERTAHKPIKCNAPNNLGQAIG